MIYLILQIFSKTALLINLKKIFFEIMMGGLNQASGMNLMTLCAFSNTYLWFYACFQFFVCITYSSLSFELATILSTFSSFSFQAKNVNLHEVHVILMDIELQLQENILY